MDASRNDGTDGGSNQPGAGQTDFRLPRHLGEVSFDDKRRVVDLMITTIAATSDSLNITWKI